MATYQLAVEQKHDNWKQRVVEATAENPEAALQLYLDWCDYHGAEAIVYDVRENGESCGLLPDWSIIERLIQD